MQSGPGQGGVLLRRRGQHARHDYHERNSKPERFRREGEEAEHGLSPSNRGQRQPHPGKACYVSSLRVSEIKPLKLIDIIMRSAPISFDLNQSAELD
jgi:hypothetical protein